MHVHALLCLGIEKAQETYNSMLEKPTTDKKLLEAAWELEEHRHLYNEAQRITQQLSASYSKCPQTS